MHPSGIFEPFDRQDIEGSLLDRFEQQVERYPDRLAVKAPEGALTYRDLNQSANRIARTLLDRCGEKSEPTALLFDAGVPFVEASLGVLKAGRIQVHLETSFPKARLDYMLRQSEATTVVTNHANLAMAKVLSAPAVVNVDEIDRDRSAGNPALSLTPDHKVAIGYTSGSTGKPKGIARTHRCVLHSIMHYTNIVRLCCHDRLMTNRLGLRYLHALSNGAAFFPVDLSRMEPYQITEWMSRSAVTVLRLAVSTFRSLASTFKEEGEFPDLRLISLYGEATYETDVELYRRHCSDHSLLHSSLGCSELDDYAHYFVDKVAKIPGGVVPGGYPIEDVEVVLLNEDGRPVDDGEVGQIAVKSHHRPDGYWRNPDATRAKVIADPSGNGVWTYKTGDLGRIDATGCISHLGRTDFQVKIRGQFVDVSEVEALLLENPEIKEAVVAGCEDPPRGTRLVAYLVPAGEHLPPLGDLRRFLTDRLLNHMVPSFFVQLEKFPRTDTGKVDRRSLPPPDKSRSRLETPFAEARTAVEEKLAAMWSEVLGVDAVGIHDCFLDLGGDSLQATQLISRVLHAFEVQLPVSALWEASTIAEMASVIVERQVECVEEQEYDRILAEQKARQP